MFSDVFRKKGFFNGENRFFDQTLGKNNVAGTRWRPSNFQLSLLLTAYRDSSMRAPSAPLGARKLNHSMRLENR